MSKILLISDVDGCLTDGGMYYTSEGKIMKRFSAGDHEGLKLLKKNGIEVIFITADRVGLPISKRRLIDMSNSEIDVVPENKRLSFFDAYQKKYDYIIFFGDGLGDAKVKKENACNLFVCPAQSIGEVKKFANIVCDKEGGHQAFLDMSIKVLEYLYDKKIIEKIEELY